MEYTTLNNTDIEVSKICLGTMTWGEQNSEEEAHSQLDMALDYGVNFIDTAEMYAIPPAEETYGRTEEIIGNWFSNTGRRDEVVLATKVAGEGVDWIRGGDYEIDRENIREAVEGSLRRLQTDYIDLYQLHWPNRGSYHFGQVWDYNPATGNKEEIEANFVEVLRTLEELREEGKIRQIGLSNETAWGTMKYLQLAEKFDLPRMITIQNEYNLLCRLFEPDLAEISLQENIGLLAWSPLASGLLTGKYSDGEIPEGTRWSLRDGEIHRDTPRAHEAVRAYHWLARKNDLDPVQMALAFVTSRPFTTATIIGATSIEQLQTNIESIELDLSENILREINRIREKYPLPY